MKLKLTKHARKYSQTIVSVPLDCGLRSVQQEYSDIFVFSKTINPETYRKNLYHDIFGNLSDGNNEQGSLQQGGEIAYIPIN